MGLMRHLSVMALLLAAPAWSAPPAAPASSVSKSTLPAVRQRVQDNKVEVARLQQEVVRQESASEQASRRLRQQDREIAELRRELSRLQAEAPAGHP